MSDGAQAPRNADAVVRDLAPLLCSGASLTEVAKCLGTGVPDYEAVRAMAARFSDTFLNPGW